MLARSVTVNVVGTAIGLVVTFVASILLARWLGPSGRGLLAVMAQTANVVFALSALGIPVAVTYYASRPDPSTQRLLGNSLLYGAILAVAFVPIFWLLRGPIGDLVARGHSGSTWALAGALVPLTFLDWSTHNQLLGTLRFVRFNVVVVLSKLAYLLAICVLIGAGGLGVGGALVALALASVVMVAGSLPPLLRAGPPLVDGGLFRSLVRYGRRVQLGAMLQLLNYRFDVFILQFFRPLREVGYYVAASVLAELVITLANAFQSSVLPLVSHYEGDEQQAATTRASLRHHGILALAATLGNAVLAPLVILYAYGASFHPSLVPLFILLPGMWFLGTGTVVAGDLRGRGRPGLSSAVAGLSVVVTVGLDLALIPTFGIAGAAAASVAAYVVYGVGSLVALERVSSIPLRELVIPTRADLALYATAARRAVTRLRGPAAPAAGEG
jgi:O-antigen/teichoic acid export membrane protein